jgi:hypothetical protein
VPCRVTRPRVAFALLSLSFAVSACTHSGEKNVGLGVSCLLLADKTYGTPSYPVREIGRAGVPALSAGELWQVRAIQRYVDDAHLRFVESTDGLMVVNARDGPCEEYRVLNQSCNAGYDPLDHDDASIAFPGPCVNTPRPWMRDDSVQGTVPWCLVFAVQPRGKHCPAWRPPMPHRPSSVPLNSKQARMPRLGPV